MQQAVSAARGIFLKNEERLCLLAPLLLLPLIFWELSLPERPSAAFLYFAAIGSEIILGGAGHTGLSWLLLTMLPEGRGLLESKNFSLSRLLVISSVLFLFLAGLFCLPPASIHKPIITAFFFFDWCYVYHHSIAQTMGLSFVYSYRLNSDPNLRSKIERTHRNQKRAYILLYLFSIMPGINYILGVPFFGTIPFRIFGFLITLLLVLYIYYTNSKLPFDQRNKMVFLTRLFLFPLSFFSIIAAVGYRALHGIEYVFIYRKLFANSKGPRPPRGVFAFTSLALFGTMSAIALFSMNAADGVGMYFIVGDSLPTWFRLLCAAATTRSYMHFYLDRLMFRMRDSAVSEWIRPLINA